MLSSYNNKMLTKVTSSNYLLGTGNIISFTKSHSYDVIQDNLDGLLLVADGKNKYIYDYTNKKYIEKHEETMRIPIRINEIVVWKQIESFDQNNPMIANKIRNQVVKWMENCKSNYVLGIGGEFYVYFKIMQYDFNIGISNHSSIISDTEFNMSMLGKKTFNYLVDYSNTNTFPAIPNYEYDIIINVVNIHENIIKFISKISFKKVIIITCKPLEKKIKMLSKYLKLVRIKHFLNINSWITICEFIKI